MSNDPMEEPVFSPAELDLIRDEVVEEHYGNAFLSQLEETASEAPRTSALHRDPGVSDWKEVALNAIREWGWLGGQTDAPIFPDDAVESWARVTIRNRIAPQASDAEMQEMAEAYMNAYITVKEGLI